MRYEPSLEELAGAERSRAIPIAREILADLDTPVSAYLKVRGTGPSFLLESVEGGERLGRYSFIGQPRRVLRVKDGQQWFEGEAPCACSDPLRAVQEVVEAYAPDSYAHGRFDGGAVGYLSYEAATYFEALPRAARDPLDLPDAAFLDVDTVLIFDHVEHTIRVVSHVWPDAPLEQAYQAATRRIERLVEALSAPTPHAPLPPASTQAYASNMTQADYEHMVSAGKEHIMAGDILQVVLSQRLQIPIEGDPFGLYRRLRSVSPSPYMYYLDLGDHQIVGTSPELLVQVEGGVVSTLPVAGTRRRGATREEDLALEKELLADEKERAEHVMLVDLGRNDIGRVSQPGTVQVTEYMRIDRFSHVMHITSEVKGRLRPEQSAFDALRATFPAGTVSGAPKIRAMQIIAALEEDQRGPYAGSVGFVTARGDMEMAITIRTGVVKDGTLYVQAGAGIVADSAPAREYVETLQKARGLLQAAGGE